MAQAKNTRGRQKIDRVKIQNEQNLQATFSKRRTGILKKASKICCLTGSKVVLVIFSPRGKAYSFGCPSIDAVIHRFESQTPVQSSDIFRSKPSIIRAFTPGAGPFRVNADSSVKDGTMVSIGENGQIWVSFSPNSSEPAIATRLPQTSQGFNSGYGGFRWF